MSFAGPLKGFGYTPNAFAHVGLIAGGAGITPCYQLIRGILSDPADNTKVTLVFGVNGDADVLLKREFDEYESKFPGRFRVRYTVSRPGESSPFEKGYVTKELLERELPGPKEEGGKVKVLMCGPPGMEEAVMGKKGKGGLLGELGYAKDQVFQF